MIITLRPSEVHFLRTIASTRSFVSRRNNVFDQKFALDKSGFEIDFDGCLTEYAFCKWHNIHFSLLFGDETAGQPDCIYNNLNIDIKSTRHPRGRMIVKLNSQPMDIYVLAIVEGDYTIHFVGYARSEDVKKDENIRNLGTGDSYVLEQDQLLKFKENVHKKN
jgi:hypothetical protein